MHVHFLWRDFQMWLKPDGHIKINRIAPTSVPELWQSVLNFLFCVFENINSQWSTHEKLFLCSCCDKAFECSHNLNCHMAIHKERNHSMAVILTRTQIRLSMASSILPELMEHDGHQSTSWHIHVKFRENAEERLF